MCDGQWDPVYPGRAVMSGTVMAKEKWVAMFMGNVLQLSESPHITVLDAEAQVGTVDSTRYEAGCSDITSLIFYPLQMDKHQVVLLINFESENF